MEIIGYFCLLIMGLVLGLIGAGGAILTIPILVYLFKVPMIIATTYSLFIVGVSSFVGALRHKHAVQFRKALIFSIPSIVGIFCARSFILPNLPDSFGIITLNQALIVLLVSLMLCASYLMINDFKLKRVENFTPSSLVMKLAFLGLSLGFVVGLIGAGGGFLIIPTLVVLMGFTMQQAVPTSLFIITINSFTGFFADKNRFEFDDWLSIVEYLIMALIGMLLGVKLGERIKGSEFKKVFGWFVLFIATTVAGWEFLL